MNHRLPFALSIFLLAVPGVSQSPEQQSPDAAQTPVATERPAWAAPELSRAVTVRDGRTGEVLAFAEMMDVLAKADAVFLGETHIDETTHRVESAVYEGIAARREGKVVLAMEMFDRDVQPVLDRYLAGECSEHEFLATSRAWGNYDTGYKPLIEFAKQQSLPVVAANFPRPLLRRLRMMGADASLDAIQGEARNLLPKKLIANSAAYWRRVDNAVRGHLAMMGTAEGDDERLYSTQSLWDNSMGEACAIALQAHPGSSVVHVNGGFHTAYWGGTARQLQLRMPAAKILTVAITPTSQTSVARSSAKPMADYIVYVEARATDVNEGTFSVFVQREIDYHLHMPKQARSGSPVPLLIWLADDGLAAADALALWQKRLGDSAAIAVVVAPYRETQDDLVAGGRWFWPDSFASDMGTMETAINKVWGYVLRHYAIDATRVCLAGEGTGATVVAAVSVAGTRMSARSIAFGPRRYAKLKDIPLPLPEYRGDGPHPSKSLQLFVAAADEGWWQAELAQHKSVGFGSTMVGVTADAWLREFEREAAIRSALGLAARLQVEGAVRRHIVASTARGRLWANLLAAETQPDALVAVLSEAPSGGVSELIDTAVSAAQIAASGDVPRCAGPFGGTTILVLPASASPEEIAVWQAMEANDPLQKRSRFHRLRIATMAGDTALPKLLAKLEQRGRKNVLIVPAVFCADGEWMRALKKTVRAFEDRMTLRWRPGLGG